MILVRCRIQGFGTLQNVRAAFRPGLNLVFAPNEGGKTTFQQFLTAMLYGQWRPDVRSQRRLEPWVDRYRPWAAPSFGGTLWCRLKDGREIELHRTFGKEAGLLEVRSATGEDISGEYERQKNGEVLFAQPHLGLPKELFESVAILRESGRGELHGQASLRDRIANLAQTGVEELSVQRCLSSLEKAIDEIGSERAPTRPYRMALDRVEALGQELVLLESRRAEYRSWLQEGARAASDAARLEAEYRTVAHIAALARSRETDQRVRSLEDLDQEILRLRDEIALNSVGPDFPAHVLEELNALAGAQESVQKRLEEARVRNAESAARLEQAAAERKPVESYEALFAGGEAESAIERYHTHLRFAVQRDSAHRQVTRFLEQRESLSRELASFPERIAASEANWEKAALEAGDRERAATQALMELTERLGGVRETISESARRDVAARNLALAFAALALTLAAVGALGSAGNLFRLGTAALAAAAVLGSVWLFRRRARIREDARPSVAEADRLQAEIGEMKTAAAVPRTELEQIVLESGLATLEDFLAASRRAGEVRASIAELSRRIREAQEQYEVAQEQCAALLARIGETLGKVGLGCSPANLGRQMDLFRNSLRKFREADRKYAESRTGAEARDRELRELSVELEGLESGIARMLGSAGVASVQAFRETCSRRQRELSLREKLASRLREQERLLAGKPLDAWREEASRRSAEVVASRITPEGELSTGEGESGGRPAPLLPYLPSVDEAAAEEKRLGAALAGAREELARLSERVANAFNGYRTPAEIEEDLAAASAELAELTRERAALEIALETLAALAREQQESLAPQLNAAVEKRFLRLCERRYEEIKIDADFAARVRVTGSGELREAEVLSRGTQDQLYFALRFGILDLLSRPEETCPGLLDEPFAAYDHGRSEEAFRILSEEAERRQLVLLTCREDVADLALRNSAFRVEFEPVG